MTDLQKDPGHAKGTIYNTLRLEVFRGPVRLVNPIVPSAKLFPTPVHAALEGLNRPEPYGRNISDMCAAI